MATDSIKWQNPNKFNELIVYLETGLSRSSSYEKANVPERTFFNWTAKPELLKQIQEAEIRYIETLKLNEMEQLLADKKEAEDGWKSHFSKDWRACQIWLERRFPDLYAKVERQEITNKTDKCLIVDFGLDDSNTEKTPPGTETPVSDSEGQQD